MNNLNGLVLVGGRSLRMGIDKAHINYHGKTQQEYLLELLRKHCKDAFVSCRNVAPNPTINHAYIVDLYPSAGPMGALLSAFAHANEPWLVVACDMPFVNDDAVGFLLQNRRPDKIATAFKNAATNNPEPLLAIWEPKALLLLQLAFENQQRSLLKVLQTADIQQIEALDPKWLVNVNTPEEQKKAGFNL